MKSSVSFVVVASALWLSAILFLEHHGSGASGKISLTTPSRSTRLPAVYAAWPYAGYRASRCVFALMGKFSMMRLTVNSTDRIRFGSGIPNSRAIPRGIFLPLPSSAIIRQNGASLLRSIDTILRGYQYALDHAYPLRAPPGRKLHVDASQMRLFLPAARLMAANRATVDLAKQLESKYHALFWRCPR